MQTFSKQVMRALICDFSGLNINISTKLCPSSPPDLFQTHTHTHIEGSFSYCRHICPTLSLLSPSLSHSLLLSPAEVVEEAGLGVCPTPSAQSSMSSPINEKYTHTQKSQTSVSNNVHLGAGEINTIKNNKYSVKRLDAWEAVIHLCCVKTFHETF